VQKEAAGKTRSSPGIRSAASQAAPGRWMQEWSDLLKFRIVPGVDDEKIGKVPA